ncbi:MAG: hypothetical protein H3C43_05730 [Leptonema sp. (in: Bacteria)]|nr:hypothetical protein [Leptonema sp. (in: bacteria)]
MQKTIHWHFFVIVIGLWLPVNLWAESCSTVLGSLFSYTKFDLYSLDKGKTIFVGSGQLLSPIGNTRLLEFEYQSERVAFQVSGRVKLEYLKNCKFRLSVNGMPNQPFQQEIVDADSLLAENRMLHFYFDRKQRFFQIRNTSGETRVVTEYGPLIFKPKPK